MQSYYLLFVAGSDKPGIVAAVTKVLYKNAINIHDSTMTRLGNTFGMILVLSAKKSVPVTRLRAALKQPVESFGLTMNLQRLADTDIAHRSPAKKEVVLTLIGGDQTGIVYRVAETLAKQKVNILTVSTETGMGEDGPLYMMVMELEVPTNVRIPSLRKKLRELAAKLKVDIHLRTIEAVTL
jgi:glycine cleavage system transcriptional repressor